MKKSVLLIFAALLALVSCNRELVDPMNEAAAPSAITFNLTAVHPSGAVTKAVKTGWETGDVIFVFFSTASAPGYLEMKWDGSAWAFAPKNSLTLADGDHGTMRAVYLPFGSDATVSASGSDYQFDKMFYSYYLTATLGYTVTGGTVSGSFNMKIPEGYVQFFLDDESAVSTTAVELREPNLTPQGIASIAANGTITHTTVAHGAPLPGYVYDKETKASGEKKGWLFSGILSVLNTAMDYHFTLVQGGWNGDYYGSTFKSQTFYRSETEGRALKLPALSAWTSITDYKPIDLGCDVSGRRLYWSSRNLDATSDFPASTSDADIEATFGGSYAWGEIATKTEYWWKNYKFIQDGYTDPDHITKYTLEDGETDGIWYNIDGDFIGDGITTIEPADDAARAVAGGIWRMPTRAEWAALIDDSTNFAWTWDEDYKGHKFTSRIAGYDDGRYIFLPGAGLIRDGSSRTAKGQGKYWSSSFNEPYPYTANAHYVNMQSTGVWLNGSSGRYCGLSVRPVTE